MSTDRFSFERAIRALPIAPPTRKLVAFTMASYANSDGTNAHPGEDRLAHDCMISTRAVRGHLAALRDLGLLVRTREGSASGRKRLADEYELAVPNDVLTRITGSLLPVDNPLTEDSLSPQNTGTPVHDHRKSGAHHRNYNVGITGSQLPPTGTSTKDVDQTPPTSNHLGDLGTDRARAAS